MAEQMESFLRARTSREENQEIVRRLLRGQSSELARAVSARTGVASALSRFGTHGSARADEPDRYAEAFAKVLGPDTETESPAELAWHPASALAS
ncbi:MAG TPA: hypothetical protein VN783_13880 [Thermoanaerobaculia bacterium]|nr:hypothetical protein [Thermoanaerobaculia bacterium]